MLQIYSDLLTDDELFSDAYPIKEVDGIAYEVDCAMIFVTDGGVKIGANPLTGAVQEALEDGAKTVNNLVHNFHLKPTTFNEESYGLHLTVYLKALKDKLAETNPDRVPAFEKGAAEFAKKIVANFKAYEFYIGESMDLDAPGMVALLNFRADGATPYFTFWKDGVKDRKL